MSLLVRKNNMKGAKGMKMKGAGHATETTETGVESGAVMRWERREYEPRTAPRRTGLRMANVREKSAREKIGTRKGGGGGNVEC